MKPPDTQKRTKIFYGEGVSPGIAIGRAYLHRQVDYSKELWTRVPAGRAKEEKRKFLDALERSRKAVQDLIRRVEKELGNDQSNIFRAHSLMLRDNDFIEEIIRYIETNYYSAESAVAATIEAWQNKFSASPLPQIRAKISDILDIGQRITENLRMGNTDLKRHLKIKGDSIFITSLFLPSLSPFIDTNRIRGIISELDNRASHSAIVARSMGIPSVFGIRDLIKRVQDGDELIMDGSEGVVILNPDSLLKKKYAKKRHEFLLYQTSILNSKNRPCITRDGCFIELYANMGEYVDAERALKAGALGIGLYRTEMPFIMRNQYPDEDLQYNLYKKVLEAMQGRPVIIRTLDLSGDKVISKIPELKRERSRLNQGAVRVFLEYPELFKVQLRAILRASIHGDIRVIIPMVSDLSEVLIIKRMFRSVKRELLKEGLQFKEDIKLGIMIEIPSAVMVAEDLIKKVDFFSVGTNDLIQYTMAIDRSSEKATKYFQSASPAILHMLRKLLAVASGANKDIFICGTMASDPLYITLLIGLGFRKFSLDPLALNHIRDIIQRIALTDAQKLAEKATRQKTAERLQNLLDKDLSRFREFHDFYFGKSDKQGM